MLSQFTRTDGINKVADVFVDDYIIVIASKHPIYMPPTAGRYQARRFRKAQCPIFERLINSLMMHRRNNGKKPMAVRSVKLKHTMEIIHLSTDGNPIQIIVDSVIFSKRIDHFLHITKP